MDPVTGLLFQGVKAGYKMFTYYKTKAKELDDLQEHADDLHKQVDRKMSIIEQVPEAKLSENVRTQLSFVKEDIEAITTFRGRVQEFAEQNKGTGKFLTIGKAIANQAISSLPAELQGVANKMVDKLGAPPQDRFAKLLASFTDSCSVFALALTVDNTLQIEGKTGKRGPSVRPAQQTMGQAVPPSKDEEELGKLMSKKIEAKIADNPDLTQVFFIRSAWFFGRTAWGVVYKGQAYVLIISAEGGSVVCAQWFIVKDASEFFQPKIMNLFDNPWSLKPGVRGGPQGTNKYIKENLPSVPDAAVSDCRFGAVMMYQKMAVCPCVCFCKVQMPSDPNKETGMLLSYDDGPSTPCGFCYVYCCRSGKFKEMSLETKSGVMRCKFPAHRKFIVIDDVEYGKVVAPMDRE